MKIRMTITIFGDKAINKLNTLGRKKGEYISKLIEENIRIDELEKEIKKLKNKLK